MHLCMQQKAGAESNGHHLLRTKVVQDADNNMSAYHTPLGSSQQQLGTTACERLCRFRHPPVCLVGGQRMYKAPHMRLCCQPAAALSGSSTHPASAYNDDKDSWRPSAGLTSTCRCCLLHQGCKVAHVRASQIMQQAEYATTVCSP